MDDFVLFEQESALILVDDEIFTMIEKALNVAKLVFECNEVKVK